MGRGLDCFKCRHERLLFMFVSYKMMLFCPAQINDSFQNNSKHYYIIRACEAPSKGVKHSYYRMEEYRVLPHYRKITREEWLVQDAI